MRVTSSEKGCRPPGKGPAAHLDPHHPGATQRSPGRSGAAIGRSSGRVALAPIFLSPTGDHSALCEPHRPWFSPARMDGEFAALRRRVHRLVDGAGTSTLQRVEAILAESTDRRPEITNPSGSSVPVPRCRSCGGARPPAPGAEPWPARSQTGRAQGALCQPCVWAQGAKRRGTFGPTGQLSGARDRPQLAHRRRAGGWALNGR